MPHAASGAAARLLPGPGHSGRPGGLQRGRAGRRKLHAHRKDLFDAAGLTAPDTYEKITAAAAALNKGGVAGITASTAPLTAQTDIGAAAAQAVVLAVVLVVFVVIYLRFFGSRRGQG
ncbi:MAG TPA: hypothetical protein VFM54_03970 [Micromonosporaceae bacterium]|nr:hypothetical protein [Micromonosporaceae bacterium]